MATAPETARQGPLLFSGDRMTRAEFHRLYEQSPEDFRAELIGGTVYVSSPLRWRHGSNHLDLSGVFFMYRAGTPGVAAGDNTTILLGDDSEPQPDLLMRLLQEYGGQSRIDGEYVVGPPELIAEISHSSRAIDLHFKRDDYSRYGVREYLVACIEERKLYWFDLARNVELPPDSDGVYRLRTFPGLWIAADALFAHDAARLTAIIQAGLASPEHAEFVRQLAEQKLKRKPT